jgi:hypothetical protein
MTFFTVTSKIEYFKLCVVFYIYIYIYNNNVIQQLYLKNKLKRDFNYRQTRIHVLK